MRVVSINVDGLREAIADGFFDWVRDQDADVICVQNHRVRAYEAEAPEFCPEGYHAFFIDGENIEDGGVGIYSRQMPKAMIYGFAYGPADQQGRFLQADFDRVSVASVLAPSALGQPEKQAEKDDFMAAFITHLRKTLRKRRQFIFCASLHTAHEVTDASPLYHQVEESGFLAHERAWLDEVFDELEMVDAFRHVSLAPEQYTWWPQPAKGVKRRHGWRTDYQILTPGIRRTIDTGWIDEDTRFSEHAPVVMDYHIDY